MRTIVNIGVVVLTLGAAALAGGCTPHRLGYDHREMRNELLKAYDEQLLDNLIRAKRGEPLLHIRYGEIKGTAATNAKLSGTIADKDTDSVNGTTIIEGDEDNTSASAEVSIASTMEVVGTPVLDDPELYEAYRAFARKFLRDGSGWDEIGDADRVLLHGRRRDIVPGGRPVTRYYWVENATIAEDLTVRDELAKLVDRTMFTQKKKAGGGLASSVDVVVLSAAEPTTPGVGEGTIELDIEIAPGVRMVHGEITLSESKKVGLGSGGGKHAVSTASATLMVIPEEIGSGVASRRRAKLYASVAQVEKLVGAAGSEDEPVEWLIAKLKGAQQKMSYSPPRGPATDLNEMVEALTDFLKRDP